MRRLRLFIVLVSLLSWATAAQATVITIDIPQYSGGFEHGRFYVYRVPAVSLLPGEQIAWATLSLDDFRDWTNEPNTLALGYVANWTAGSTYAWTRPAAPPAGTVVFWTLNNLPVTPADYGPQPIPGNLAFMSAAPFGITLDPMCHFYGDLSLEYETVPSVPEPASLLLLGTGLLGIARLRRGRR